MSKLSKVVYLTVHGHFYQPPRENPWIERIELQPDARPFHNWNDRILIQCYQPNAMARIVDAEGKVLEIVNNFRLLSFNIGPTLLSWLERHAPVIYHRILEGDRLSLREHSGHGNAIAQVYNHMILPLAREEDQRTQIRWGVSEFRHRFGRDPEGIWLPETAASERTLEILIEEGIRFTILAPEQAAAVRPLQNESSSWQDVSNGSIDPTRPYRFFHSLDRQRWMDLFFFDGPLSRDTSFGDLLFDAKKFTERLENAHHRGRQHPELIHIACDGETFGHHKAFGERVVAFVLHEEAEQHGFKRMNYGEYLEKFPPQYEVKIKAGEGTSWSCSHGVARWKEDCGCRVGGGAGWNQKWRRPLRDAVRFLGEELGRLYKKESSPFFSDPWAARDGYIELILDRSEPSRKKFFGKFSTRPLAPQEEIRALKLLEMERYALLTETSCGWFFNDLSGTETVQILRYALRALELAGEFGEARLEKEFVAKLAHAKSNRPEFGDGRGVWEKLVKPARVPPEKLVAHYAFRTLFEMKISKEDFYSYRIEEEEKEQETEGEMTLFLGRVRLAGRAVPESQNFIYAIFREEMSRVHCFVKPQKDADELRRIDIAPLGHLRKKDGKTLLKSLKQSFGNEPFSLRDLFPEERDEILRLLSRQMRQVFYDTTLSFYEENRPSMALFREAGRPVPEEFRGAMEWVLGERLFEWVKKLDTKVPFEEIKKQTRGLLEEARSEGFSVRTQSSVEFLSRKLNTWIEKLFHEPDPGPVEKIEKALELAKSLEISLHDWIVQDLFFAFAQKILREWIDAYHRDPTDRAMLERIQAVIRLGGQLGFNMRQYEYQLKSKAEVR